MSNAFMISTHRNSYLLSIQNKSF